MAGWTFQVGRLQITGISSILPLFFNTTLVALTINLASGLF
jgi:uncharacterized membrane protein